MSSKTPIRTVFNDSNVATGLAEFQTGEFIPLSHGGIGAALSIGSAGQVLKVNSGATALEFGAVEAIVNIDGATDLTGQTLVASDKLLASDGGTEGRINLSQIDTLFTGTTQTLTNKTISGSSNTLSNIGNSSLSNSTVNFGGVSLALGASDTTPAFDLSDATSYPTSSLTGTITNAQLAGSIANSKLSNSTVTIGTTSIALGASNTTIAGISNLTAGGINITGNSITSADSSIIEMGEGLSITGNLTVSGNMTVSGSTTTLETTNSTITDKLIELGNGTSGTPSGDAGIVIERGSSNNAFIGFDESADKFIVGTGTFTGSTTGDLTITTGTLVGNLEGNVTGNVTGNVSGSSGSTTGNAATATALATARNIGGVSFDGTGNINLPGVNTSGTQDTSGNAATATALETARNIHGVSFDGTGNIDLSEVIQDTVGAMFSSNTETNITATYQDSDGTIDLVVSASGIASVAADSSPQLGGDLDVNGNSIVSASNGNISITPNGSGSVIIDGLSHPQADGNAGQVLKTDGSGQLAFASVSSLAGAGIQNVSDDSSPQLGGNLDVVTHNIVSTSNRNITLAPNGSGKVVVGTNGIEFGDGTTQTSAGATTGFSIAMATALG